MTLLCALYLTSGSLDLLIIFPIRFIFRILTMLCIKCCKVINVKVFKTRIFKNQKQLKESPLILKSFHILVLSKIKCSVSFSKNYFNIVFFELLLCHRLCFSSTVCFPYIYHQAVLAAKRTLETF